MTESLTAGALRAGLSRETACELFDALPSVALDEMTGRWRGSEVPTGHPMDGLLAMSGWYGKQFDDVDHVHPLLFGTPGSLYPVNPKAVPIGVLNRVGPSVPRISVPDIAFRALRTRRHRARLRTVEYRGVSSAAMVYDDLPIIDHFRRLGPDALLGSMDLRGSDRPYFFLLERD